MCFKALNTKTLLGQVRKTTNPRLNRNIGNNNNSKPSHNFKHSHDKLNATKDRMLCSSYTLVQQNAATSAPQPVGHYSFFRTMQFLAAWHLGGSWRV